MKWILIRTLLKCAWGVFRHTLLMESIRYERGLIQISLWRRDFYEAKFKVDLEKFESWMDRKTDA